MSVPAPTDPNFTVDPTEDEFLHPKGEEDAALLATGAWDDVPAENDEGIAVHPRVRVHTYQ